MTAAAAMTEGDIFLEMSQLSSPGNPSLTPDAWRAIMSLPADLREATLANFRDEDWSNPATSIGQRMIALITLLGTIAGVVGGVAGAAGAVKALTGH